MWQTAGVPNGSVRLHAVSQLSILPFFDWLSASNTWTLHVHRNHEEKEMSMGRIKTLTRPNVNTAYVRQGFVLDILEKQLRNALSNLDGGLSKPDEE